MNDLGKNVIDKINLDGVTPIPKWHFLLKKTVIWSFTVIATLIGAIAMGIIITQVKSTEWELFSYYSDTPLELVISLLPFLWFSILIGFVFIAKINFQHTTTGHRYGVFFILAGVVLSSTVFGYIFNLSGFSNYFESKLTEYVPSYEEVCRKQDKFWMSPERGLLIGTIAEVESSDSFTFIDIKKSEWQISAKDALWRGETSPKKGNMVRLFGNTAGKALFVATDVRPAPGRGKWRKRKCGEGPRNGQKGRGFERRNKGGRHGKKIDFK